MKRFPNIVTGQSRFGTNGACEKHASGLALAAHRSLRAAIAGCVLDLMFESGKGFKEGLLGCGLAAIEQVSVDLRCNIFCGKTEYSQGVD